MQSDLERKTQALAQAVIGPLTSGLQSFNTVSEMLLNEKTGLLLPECQTFREIRLAIENMKLELEKAEQVAMTELRQLDGETESLTAQQSRLAQQKKQRERKLADLNKELNSNKFLLNKSTGVLQEAKNRQRSAEETLQNLRQRGNKGRTLQNVGAGVLAIPIFGWIAGE